MTDGLRLQTLRGGYGKHPVLHGVDLSVAPAEIAVIVGPNGAGKTTLARTIAGTLATHGGEIHWGGRRIESWNARRRIAAGISLVPQGAPSFPHLDVMQNIQVSSSCVERQTSPAERVESALKLFPELIERRHQLAGTLSGGQRQMLAIARAIAQRPDLLVIDEPSFGLAVGVRQRVVNALRALQNQQGTTIVVVEQDLNMVKQLADRVYYMANGEIQSSHQADTDERHN